LDANSIIYDNLNTDGLIYENVYNSILEIIKKINPKKTFVCFDGVAPLAKISQQKTRRYKSWLTKEILNIKKEFNSNAITPGTIFMKELNDYLKLHLDNNIILSGSDEPGEGEYKIFNYIRNEDASVTHMVYGLDADLIMLSLLQCSKSIYLYRETKHFSYLKYVNDNVDYVLDVCLLGEQIINIFNKPNAIEEYCLLCFFCGNDFLPHFPSINIRNNGIDYLIEQYKFIDCSIIISGNISWDNLMKLCLKLSEQETLMINKQIDWKKHRRCSNITHEDRLNNLPVFDTELEEYLKLNPDKYNETLFNQTEDEYICLNYLEMFEWTWKYYKGEPVDLYKYYMMDYAPKFNSLINYVPINSEFSFLTNDINTQHVNPITQLIYVLPYSDYDLIPFIDKEDLINNFPSLKELNFNIQYTFCCFFWEAHVEFNDISIKDIDYYINNNVIL